MSQKFNIIVADLPWNFSDSLKMSDVKRGAKANYSTMTTAQLKALPVAELADPEGCIFALWCPSSLLQDGLDIMKAYKFDFKQSWIWVKIKNDPFKDVKDTKNIDWNNLLSFGMGRLGRNVHEVVLIGVRGKIYKKLKNKSQRTVFFYKNTKHSKKPELLQDKLELMFDGEKIELFARRSRPGWVCIGNEICNGEDITVSLAKIING